MKPDLQTASPLEIRERDEGCVFPVVVQPRAKKNQIVGIQEGALKIKVTAPPVEGAANEAVIKVLARTLGKAKSCFIILKGQTSPRKLVQCQGLSGAELEETLKKIGG